MANLLSGFMCDPGALSAGLPTALFPQGASQGGTEFGELVAKLLGEVTTDAGCADQKRAGQQLPVDEAGPFAQIKGKEGAVSRAPGQLLRCDGAESSLMGLCAAPLLTALLPKADAASELPNQPSTITLESEPSVMPLTARQGPVMPDGLSVIPKVAGKSNAKPLYPLPGIPAEIDLQVSIPESTMPGMPESTAAGESTGAQEVILSESPVLAADTPQTTPGDVTQAAKAKVERPAKAEVRKLELPTDSADHEEPEGMVEIAREASEAGIAPPMNRKTVRNAARQTEPKPAQQVVPSAPQVAAQPSHLQGVKESGEKPAADLKTFPREEKVAQLPENGKELGPNAVVTQQVEHHAGREIAPPSSPETASAQQGLGGSRQAGAIAQGVSGVPSGRPFNVANLSGPEMPFETAMRSKIIRQVVRAAEVHLFEGGGNMTLRLDPPHLGTVQMSVSVDNGSVTANLQTGTATASHLLQSDLPALKQALADAGINVDAINVSVGGNSGQGWNPHSGNGGRDAGNGEPRHARYPGWQQHSEEPFGLREETRPRTAGRFDHLA
ncbi:MAG: flagellar hook-length control protein FliK [Armatimonadota bacterium]